MRPSNLFCSKCEKILIFCQSISSGIVGLTLLRAPPQVALSRARAPGRGRQGAVLVSQVGLGVHERLRLPTI